eukprot:1138711-Pelagomonas_calceolata.AAC.2
MVHVAAGISVFPHVPVLTFRIRFGLDAKSSRTPRILCVCRNTHHIWQRRIVYKEQLAWLLQENLGYIGSSFASITIVPPPVAIA